MNEPTPIGPILDNLGLHTIVGDHEAVTDAIVILRGTNFDTGQDNIVFTITDHTGYITQRGMIEVARDFIEMASPALYDHDDEEPL